MIDIVSYQTLNYTEQCLVRKDASLYARLYG